MNIQNSIAALKNDDEIPKGIYYNKIQNINCKIKFLTQINSSKTTWLNLKLVVSRKFLKKQIHFI